MKVKELQEALAKLDPEMDVLCVCDDDELPNPLAVGHVVFDIRRVDAAQAERRRTPEGDAALKIGESDRSEAIAILDVTTAV